MIRIRRFILIVFLTVIYLNGSAQNSRVVYYMKIPQNHFFNPAIKPSSSFYLGLPLLTNINAGINNNFLELTDLFRPDLKTDSVLSFQNPDFDLGRFAEKLKEHNNISMDVNIQLFGLGFMIGKDLNIFVDINDRINASASLPKDLMKLYILGPEQFRNLSIDLSGLNIRAQYFREFGVGFSKNITPKLRIGAKAKMLFGLNSFSLDNRKMSLKVNDDYSQTISADATLNASGKERANTLKSDLDSMKNKGNAFRGLLSFGKDYLKTPFSNLGFGFDFGAVYNLNKMFSFSASVTDLGFINWKDDLKSYDAKKTFGFQAVSLADIVNQSISIDEFKSMILDTIKASFVENPNPASFRTSLPAGVLLGANINLFNVLSIGILSDSKIYNGQVKEAVTLSANAYLGKILSASLSYTTANYSFNNFGCGLALKGGPVQIFMVADKIPLNWSKVYFKKGEGNYKSIGFPDQWNTLSLQIGMNITFGKIVSKKVDKPMLLETANPR